MSAIIGACPLCGGAAVQAMTDTPSFVAHIRACHAAEMSALQLQNRELEARRIAAETGMKNEERRAMLLIEDAQKLRDQLQESNRLNGEYEKRIPELCAEYLKKLEDANLLIEGMRKTFLVIAAANPSEVTGYDYPHCLSEIHALANAQLKATAPEGPSVLICQKHNIEGDPGEKCGQCFIEKRKCECVWLDGGPVGEYRDRRAPCTVHDKRKCASCGHDDVSLGFCEPAKVDFYAELHCRTCCLAQAKWTAAQ